MEYKVYYMKPDTFYKIAKTGIESITLKDVGSTHIFLKTVEADNLNDIYYMMQGENWSPNGEARELILSKSLKHTSMSIGDIIHNITNDEWHIVDIGGFKLL